MSKNDARETAIRPAHRRPTSVSSDCLSLYSANGARKYLNSTERNRALVASTLLSTEKAAFLLTLAWTGARVSEVLALTPVSFQVERDVVAIRTLKRRRHSVREVPVPSELMKRLNEDYQLERALHDPDLAVRRLWPWCRQTGWRIVKYAMSCAQLHGIAATPRGLRHSFGVGTIQAGIPITITQRWLGHSRLSSTAIYTDVCGHEEQALAKRFFNARPQSI